MGLFEISKCGVSNGHLFCISRYRLFEFPISVNRFTDIGQSFSDIVKTFNDIGKFELSISVIRFDFPISVNDLPISENKMLCRYRKMIRITDIGNSFTFSDISKSADFPISVIRLI